MDVQRSLRTAAQTGKVALGAKESLRAISQKKAKLVILAKNAPDLAGSGVETAAQQSRVPVYRFDGLNTELGPALGKPFSVAVAAVLEAGESDVLDLARAPRPPE
ncbi:MAG TPA: 50S ribosomal protein L30e [Candidatus Thermoplasmatota archaeon]|nr:50S ribosomal protein L30e [Candidatus Thermoplasmatota archaeon]